MTVGHVCSVLRPDVVVHVLGEVCLDSRIGPADGSLRARHAPATPVVVARAPSTASEPRLAHRRGS